ncbi:MAG: S-layer homology domain-containing protein [bacterium]
MNSLHISVNGITETTFGDIPTGEGSWAMPYTQKAQQLGIVYGQTIGGILKFRPNDSITRAEAVIILLRAANIPVNSSLQTTDFQDILDYA